MIEEFDLFPTKFFTYKIPDDKLLKSIYSEVYEKRDEIRAISWVTQEQSIEKYISDYTNPVKIENFHLALDMLVHSFAEKGLLFVPEETYWTALYKSGSSHGLHNHKKDILSRNNYSGVFYLTNSGSTTIFSDNPSSFEKITEINSDAGRFVLFPSTIPHAVCPNLDSDEERCIIAFNGELRKL